MACSQLGFHAFCYWFEAEQDGRSETERNPGGRGRLVRLGIPPFLGGTTVPVKETGHSGNGDHCSGDPSGVVAVTSEPVVAFERNTYGGCDRRPPATSSSQRSLL